MLVAYLDEIGQPGPFVSLDHPRFNESPAFGYAGFAIDEKHVREFGAVFTKNKRRIFPEEERNSSHSGRWEKKGSELLYAKAAQERPQNIRALASLINFLNKLGGKLFYYADEKPIGTPRETNTGPEEFKQREAAAMNESLNRLARYADASEKNLLVMMDQINEKSRKQRLPEMYAHILGRATKHEDMRRILEPPMHIDSQLSANIQFADWIAALVKRAIEYQLVQESRYSWLPKSALADVSRGKFTYESKLHLYERSIGDINNSDILSTLRPVQDKITQNEENTKRLEQVRIATMKDNTSR